MDAVERVLVILKRALSDADDNTEPNAKAIMREAIMSAISTLSLARSNGWQDIAEDIDAILIAARDSIRDSGFEQSEWGAGRDSAVNDAQEAIDDARAKIAALDRLRGSEDKSNV